MSPVRHATSGDRHPGAAGSVGPVTELDPPPNPVSPLRFTAGWSQWALEFAGRPWGRRVSVLVLMVLLAVYLLIAAIGAVRPGLVWLTVLAGALFLVTVVGSALFASAASSRHPS